MKNATIGKSAAKHILLVQIPDQTGLIFKITGVLFSMGLNILENHEYVDAGENRFYMRTEVVGELDEKKIIELKSGLAKVLGSQAKIQIQSTAPKKIVLFATKEPHCLGDILVKHSEGDLGAQVTAVVSQYSTLKKLTQRFDVPFYEVPVETLSREEHEAKLIKLLETLKFDYLVLAKYMRILTPSFVAHFPNQMINIHHSFLPAFVGKSPYHQAYERGVKIIGATAHFVNEALDEGPIITQSVIPVSHALDATMLARAGRDVEKVALAKALNLVLEDRVIVNGKRTLVFE